MRSGRVTAGADRLDRHRKLSEDPLPTPNDPAGETEAVRTIERPRSGMGPSRPTPDASPPVEPRSGGAWVVAASIPILAAAILPYLWAVFRPAPGEHFWGAIWYAPDDSLLLSVMWEGLRGHWLHVPPYAVAEGPGALFYPVHNLLGHLCAWTGLDPVPVFHGARLGCGVILLLSLRGFVHRFFPAAGERRFAYFIAATGCGLGWLFLFFTGFESPELSAPEVYPFFAMLTSLHLTLAIAALLWVLDALVPQDEDLPGSVPGGAVAIRRWARFLAGVLVLALTQPFGCVLAFCVGALWAVVRWRREQRFPRAEAIALFVLVAVTSPFVLHQLSTIASNPAYAGWRTQVRTPTPPLWQALVAVGLALPFALAGLVDAARRRRSSDLLLLFWVGAMVALMALPYYQSRRFDLAGYVPLAILAVRGIGALRLDWSGSARILLVLVNGATSLLLIGTCALRITGTDPEIFVTQQTWDVIRQLREHAPERSVVLARPTTSLALLASAPLRVVFGHPAETPRAPEALSAVRGFFDEGVALGDSLEHRIDFILVEPRTTPGPAPPIPAGFRRIFASGAVSLYGRRP
jgi:hypothetical protein